MTAATGKSDNAQAWREVAAADQATKSEQDRLAFGKPTAELEWDGIRKLDMPPPRWWVLTFWACCVFALVWWILYPSWPAVRTYFPGLLGYDQRAIVAQQIADAEARRAPMLAEIGQAEDDAEARRAPMLAEIGQAEDLEQVRTDPRLIQYAVTAGAIAFANNCAPCHGLGGAGQRFFPSLADDQWIWGGTLDAIQQTIIHGVRNGEDPEARDSQMPAFGADQILTRAQISDVAEFVLSLSGTPNDNAAATRGATVFAENCVACHGEDGAGMQELGAPSLRDAISLYGGDKASIAAQVSRPRHGVMPAFGERLDGVTVKLLALYVHSLGGGQ